MKKDNLQRLRKFLSSQEGWVTATDLASYLHTTPRTINNYVQQINKAAAPHAPILSSPKGYRWQSETISRTPYTLTHLFPETPGDRIYYIIRKLLYNDMTTISSLISSLSISERALEKDFIRIKKILKNYNLRLRIRKDVLHISGKEIDRRRLIVECIIRSSNVQLLTLDYIRKSFSHMDIDTIHCHLLDTLSSHSLTIDSYHLNHLLLHIILQISQIKRGNYIKEDEFTFLFEIQQLSDWDATMRLAHLLCDEKEWPLEEVRYLAMMIVGYTFPQRPEIHPDDPLWIKWNPLATESLQIAERYLKIDYMQENFPLHLTHFYIRMYTRQLLQLGRPHLITQSVREGHPLLLDIAANMLLYLQKHIMLPAPEQETGFLALFLAEYLYGKYLFESRVTCTLISPFGRALTDNIICELNRRLGNILTIQHVISSIDIDTLPADSQLTISLIPIKHVPHTVMLSPLPKSEDYRAIRQEIKVIKQKRDQKLLNTYFTAYSQPMFFSCDHNWCSHEEVLHYISQQLIEQHIVDDAFESLLLQREVVDSTAFYNRVALPHACSTHVNRNVIYVVNSQSPIHWGNDHVNSVILIALQEDCASDFYMLYGLLVKLLANTKHAQLLQKVTTYEELIDVVSHFS